MRLAADVKAFDAKGKEVPFNKNLPEQQAAPAAKPVAKPAAKPTEVKPAADKPEAAPKAN